MSNHPFDLMLELDRDQMRLDCAALHLARDRYPHIDVTHYLRMLDKLANNVAELRPGLAANLRYRAMREILVKHCGLTGNRERYYALDNCFVSRVLDTGVGIPITLSTVWIEVGRRLKWPVSGVALPGHFIVRFDDHERYVLADPFNEGRALSIADCRMLVRQRFGDALPFDRHYLKRIDKRGILARLLRNLRNIYLVTNDLPRAARILERMAVMEPRNGQHLQDLAAICWRQGDVRTACAHLQRYLKRIPRNEQTENVRRSLKQLKATLVALN